MIAMARAMVARVGWWPVGCAIAAGASLPMTPIAVPVAAQTRAEGQLKPRYAAFSAALAAGDLPAVAGLYAADASFELRTPGGQDRVRGSEAIAEQWARPISQGVVTFDVTTTEAKLQGESIVEQGTFVMKRKDATVFAKGTYTGEWRRDGSVWKLVRHLIVIAAG